jgi:lysophospholipase L1-like esterase
VRDALRTEGRRVELDSMARVSMHSGVFHRSALQAIARGGYTHAVIQSWSINDTTGGAVSPYSIDTAIARTKQLVHECMTRGITPIVTEPVWNGTAAAVLPTLGAFIDSIEAQGTPVIRLWQTWCVDGSKQTLRSIYDAGDGIHPNDAGHQAVANLIMAQRYRFGLNNATGASVHDHTIGVRRAIEQAERRKRVKR